MALSNDDHLGTLDAARGTVHPISKESHITRPRSGRGTAAPCAQWPFHARSACFNHSPPSQRRTGSATSSRAFSSGHRHHAAAAPFGLAQLELLGLEFPAGPEVSAYRLAPPERAIEFGAWRNVAPRRFFASAERRNKASASYPLIMSRRSRTICRREIRLLTADSVRRTSNSTSTRGHSAAGDRAGGLDLGERPRVLSRRGLADPRERQPRRTGANRRRSRRARRRPREDPGKSH